MAKDIKNRSAKPSFKKAFHSPFFIYWDKINYVLFFAGLFLLVIGFYVMSLGNWNSSTALFVAPVILFIAYIVVFPLAIFYRSKNVKTEGEEKVAPSQS
jgi:phosphotransferase system  glucose/maltose/N-acetylglucosamine-specific IIC component